MNRRSKISIFIFFIGLLGALIWGYFHPRSSKMDEKDKPFSSSTKDKTLKDLPLEASSFFDKGMLRREVVLMGSPFVFVVDAEAALANKALRQVVDRLRELENLISSWRPGSEITKLNNLAGLKPVAVSKDTFALLELSQKLYHQTKGSFDVTIGPVWDLWPFRHPQRSLPSKKEIQKALKLVDASQIQLDAQKQRAYLPQEGMKVNLGAIGKGYAAKIAIEMFQKLGVHRAAVSAGGDIYLLGKKKTGPWVVAIENPAWPDNFIERFVAGDVAVATSGISKNYILREGKRYGHILDPRSGYPAEGTQSVTVLTADPAYADAYATAIFVMGPQKGLAWVERQPDTEAMIIDRNGMAHRSSQWYQATGRPEKTPVKSAGKKKEQAPGDGLNISNRDIRQKANRTTPFSHLIQPLKHSVDEEAGKTLMIPAGKFLSGDQNRLKELQAYLIDQTEVTNQEYVRFLRENQKDSHRFCHPNEPLGKDHQPRYWREFRAPLFQQSVASQLAPFNNKTFRKPDHPVTGVDWWDAYAFARWVGKRLPAKDEWEKAARGTDGRLWSWGNQWEPGFVNSGGEKWGEQDGYIYSAPVFAFPEGASVYGSLNMAGNAAEWTQEGYVMGGSSNSNPSGVRASAGILREPGFRSFDIGFRCAASIHTP